MFSFCLQRILSWTLLFIWKMKNPEKISKKSNRNIMTNVEYASNHKCKHTHSYILIIMYKRGFETFLSKLRRLEWVQIKQKQNSRHSYFLKNPLKLLKYCVKHISCKKLIFSSFSFLKVRVTAGSVRNKNWLYLK